MAVLSPQHGGNTAFFSNLSAGGLYGWGIVLIVLWELQEIKRQSLPAARFQNQTASPSSRRTLIGQGLDKVKGSVIVCGCFISTVRWKYNLFIRFSPWRDLQTRHFAGYPFGTSRKKASTIFYNTAFHNTKTCPPFSPNPLWRIR